jgi:hypothetical protein
MTLDELAIKHKTDKSSLHHNYAVIYEKYFEPLRHEKITLAECGIGGYEFPDRGGESLRMWREYFSAAYIAGFDLHPKTFKIDGVLLFEYDQCSDAMARLCQGANIFIDDASHINPLSIKTFDLIWPVIAPGGYYVIEDTESSYCPADGWAKGCADPYNLNADTVMNLCLRLAISINRKYFSTSYGCYYPRDVEFVHFYQNIVIIKKKN